MISFLIKNYDLLIFKPLYRTSKLQEKPSSLKREHSALLNMKLLKICSISVGHFCPSDSGPTDLIESGSNPDPIRIQSGSG